MNYKQTLDYLYSRLPAYHRIGKAAYKADLNTTVALDEYFGHPHRKFRSIHIAGTNGKGSVSHMLASVLQTAGLKTGLYTSPHLKEFRERIRIDGEMIPEKYVVRFVEENRKIIEQLQPSFFELTVAMAFEYFASMETEIAVIETGLGGRLDSTNIITPLISVITNIGHDHMDLLGDTLEKVAYEKAGIIKPGVPVIVGETQTETANVIENAALRNRSELVFADKFCTCIADPFNNNSDFRNFYVSFPGRKEPLVISSPLAGDYQTRNIPVVISACLKLSGIYPELQNEEIIAKGIADVVKNSGFAGRWQIISRQPLIICDTGHNKEGIEYITRQLAEIKKGRKHLIIGFVKDKDLDSILPLFPPEAKYYFTKPSVMRGLDENILKETGRKYGLKGEAFPTVEDALNCARKHAEKEDTIFIGGSTFIVADIL